MNLRIQVVLDCLSDADWPSVQMVMKSGARMGSILPFQTSYCFKMWLKLKFSSYKSFIRTEIQYARVETQPLRTWGNHENKLELC